jgi:hypothetical protein
MGCTTGLSLQASGVGIEVLHHLEFGRSAPVKSIMKLWLLRPRDDLPDQDDPWWNRHDKAHGFVVRAQTEQQAREIAHQHAGDENQASTYIKAPWLDPRYSTCKQLLPDVGMEGVIIRDYLTG